MALNKYRRHTARSKQSGRSKPDRPATDDEDRGGVNSLVHVNLALR
jgi:hypothetical protein